jgi:hypothetical protein
MQGITLPPEIPFSTRMSSYATENQKWVIHMIHKEHIIVLHWFVGDRQYEYENHSSLYIRVIILWEHTFTYSVVKTFTTIESKLVEMACNIPYNSHHACLLACTKRPLSNSHHACLHETASFKLSPSCLHKTASFKLSPCVYLVLLISGLVCNQPITMVMEPRVYLIVTSKTYYNHQSILFWKSSMHCPRLIQLLALLVGEFHNCTLGSICAKCSNKI